MPKRQNQNEPTRRARDAILDVLTTQGEATTGELARAVGVTRQAIQYHLARLLSSGQISRSGAGPATRYSRTAAFAKGWRIEDSSEDEVWEEVRDGAGCIRSSSPEAQTIFNYVITEMVNNALDHSSGTVVEVTVRCTDDVAEVVVEDDGVGAFAHLRDRLGLPDAFAAIQQLSKGRETTDPDRHSGEGIFFSSKAVDRFELHSSGLRWTVDNRRHDQAVGDSHRRTGTLVRMEVDVRTRTALADVFRPYTSGESFEFDTTRATVRLFESGGSFVSRSEAKRLATRLERFRTVILDFENVHEVGQGFVDELFRVWHRDHAEVELIPTNMSPAVEMMIRRGLSRRPESPGPNPAP